MTQIIPGRRTARRHQHRDAAASHPEDLQGVEHGDLRRAQMARDPLG